MAIFTNTEHLASFKNAVITIGTFDGVHLGHKKILQEVVKHATDANGESVLITFEPHPRKLLFPNDKIRTLTPLHQKIKLVQASGIEHIVVMPFTKAFSMLSAKEYISEFLAKYFHPHTIVIGHDHHFGHDRKGNIQLLKQCEEAYGYRIFEIPVQLIDEASISSTKIRKAIETGQVHEARLMLGRNYSICGKVVKGAQLGRTLGYPTANIEPNDKEQIIPATGIYAVQVKWNDKLHNGMLSIGYNPTVTEEKILRIEVNIFDFDHDIYGHEMEIEFVAWLRNEEKFNSLDELKQQLHDDKIQSLHILGK